MIGKINNMDEKAKTISQVNGSLINTNAIKKKNINNPCGGQPAVLVPPWGNLDETQPGTGQNQL